MEREYSEKFYKKAKEGCTFAMKAIYDARVEGQENIPMEGPVILVGNHLSMLDIPFLYYASPREVRIIGKKQLFNIPVFSTMAYKMGAFPVDRDNNDIRAGKKSFSILKNGEVLGIFAEGHRNKKEELLPFYPGTATFAIRTKSPIVPFGISGEYRIRSGITIRFGEAIQFTGCKVEEATDCIRNKVMELKRR
jgi:1-acyl-sn-glycerol-3-phosphate acyltransferase